MTQWKPHYKELRTEWVVGKWRWYVQTRLSISLVVSGRREITGKRKSSLIMSTRNSRPPETAAGAVGPLLFSLPCHPLHVVEGLPPSPLLPWSTHCVPGAAGCPHWVPNSWARVGVRLTLVARGDLKLRCTDGSVSPVPLPCYSATNHLKVSRKPTGTEAPQALPSPHLRRIQEAWSGVYKLQYLRESESPRTP